MKNIPDGEEKVKRIKEAGKTAPTILPSIPKELRSILASYYKREQPSIPFKQFLKITAAGLFMFAFDGYQEDSAIPLNEYWCNLGALFNEGKIVFEQDGDIVRLVPKGAIT